MEARKLSASKIKSSQASQPPPNHETEALLLVDFEWGFLNAFSHDPKKTYIPIVKIRTPYPMAHTMSINNSLG